MPALAGPVFRGLFLSMADAQFMQLALRLARRGGAATSPNPRVGAVLVRGGKIIGRGWHRRSGGPHAEIEALRDAQQRGHRPRGATLYITLEPCSTQGRTPPCTDAIIASGIRRVICGATDPNPKHAGRGFKLLKRAGIAAVRWGGASSGPGRKIADECVNLNEAINHWIVRRTPFVTVKAAMTLDGKIATAAGESKWITGEQARAHGMILRRQSDAILVGVNTVLADDPALTVRAPARLRHPGPRRIVLDSLARTPLTARVVSDENAPLTTIVVSRAAPKRRVAALAKKVDVLVAPANPSASKIHPATLDLKWLLKKLGAQNVTSLLVEGGGEVNASFLLAGFARRVAFFYAPKILGGRDSLKGVAGDGVKSLADAIRLRDVRWRRLGPDLLLTARVGAPAPGGL